MPCEGERLHGVHLDEQLLLDAARTDLGQLLNERVDPSHEREVMVEHEDGLGQAQAVGERAAGDGSLHEEVLHARHALARGEDLAGRVGGVRGVDHRAGLGRNGGEMVEHVEADLPGLMELGGRPAEGHEGLARLELRAVGQDACNGAPKLGCDAGGHLASGEHARLAGEVLQFPRLGVDAQNMAGQVDIRHVLGDELVDAGVGQGDHRSSLDRFLRWKSYHHRTILPHLSRGKGIMLCDI